MDNMDKKLIVFTNIDSLKVSMCKENREKFANYFQSMGNVLRDSRICKFEGCQLSKAENICDGKIFLLHDSINNEEFSDFVNGYNKENLYILYHTVQEKSFFNFSEFSHAKKAQHGRMGDAYYLFCEKIIEMKNINKSIKTAEIDEIIEAVFGIDNELNTVLEFLHKCLLNTVTDDDKKKLSEGLSLSKEEKAKLNNPKDNLSKIRDMLLGKIFN